MTFVQARTMRTTDRASVRPLYVNNCGYYRDLDAPAHTCRAAGRADQMLLLVVRGAGCRPDLGQRFGPNTVMRFRPRQPQDYIYEPGADTLYYYLHFSGRDAAAYADALLPDTASVDAAPIAAYLDEIITELRTHPTGFEVRCAGLLLCVLSETARRIARPDPSMAALTAWLDAHYAEPLTAPQLDALCGGHARSVVRQFQQYTGRTPAQYQQQLRLAAGARLLLDTDTPIARVAEQVGYGDALYFSRLFRRRYGKSPAQYRRGD